MEVLCHFHLLVDAVEPMRKFLGAKTWRKTCLQQLGSYVLEKNEVQGNYYNRSRSGLLQVRGVFAMHV